MHELLHLTLHAAFTDVYVSYINAVNTVAIGRIDYLLTLRDTLDKIPQCLATLSNFSLVSTPQ